MLALPMARLAVGVRTTHVGSMHGRARPRLAGPVRSSGTVVPGLCEIADRYDAVLLDQFGVLHDGKRSLAGAEDCFKRLAAAGKKLIVLSNTSRRRDFAMKRLPGLGFDPQALLGFVCSGEEAHAAMRESWRGRRVLWISWDDDCAPQPKRTAQAHSPSAQLSAPLCAACAHTSRAHLLALSCVVCAAVQAWQSDYLDGLELTLASAAEADFVLCHGSMVLRDGSAEPAQTGLLQMGPDGEPHSPPEPVPSDALLGALRESAARGLPMLCANPDFQVTLPNGERGHMPGLIARLYEEQGGAVTYYGKPHGSVFKLPLIAAAHAATPPLQRPTRLLKAARRTREEGASLTAW